MEFLPLCRQDMIERGWRQCDFVYVIGDAYVDHPSFGHAIISRVLEQAGYSVGIISQPDWKNPNSIDIYGRPRLGFLVTGGNIDPMVNHYAVSKRRRKTDAYTPGGVMGKRPDYATVVYCNLIRQVYKDVPIIIGGIEASLRRLAHYDYLSDSMKRSILLDSQADLLSYGMGEKSIVEIAEALNAGMDVKDITYIDGTVFRTRQLDESFPTIVLPGFDRLKENRRAYAESFRIQYQNCDPFTAKRLAEPYGNEFVVQNPPQKPLTTQEMDAIYALPYCRNYHPSYEKLGGVPAIEEVKFSLVSCRGCFGACSFCALTFHQGRIIQARSHASILKEAELMTKDPDFKGYIHDVGGPTANFRFPGCEKQLTKGTCPNRQCLYPTPCKNLRADHADYVSLLRKLRKLPGVKKVFVRSGIRFDYLLADKKDTFFKELVQYHISGQLKVAPEHVSDVVLSYMGKPKNGVYNRFVEKYFALNHQYGMKQFLVPYLMSSHPGSRLHHAGGGEAGGVHPGHGLQPGAGAGFLPHPLHFVHGDVLYRAGSPYHGKGICPHQSPREGHAAGAHPVPGPQELLSGAGGSAEGSPGGSHRLRPQVPHPGGASQTGKAPGSATQGPGKNSSRPGKAGFREKGHSQAEGKIQVSKEAAYETKQTQHQALVAGPSDSIQHFYAVAPLRTLCRLD